MTTTVATLDTALQAVAVALKQLAADSAGEPMDPGYWSRRADAEKRCTDALAEQVGARFTPGGHAYRVRIAGLSSGSTTGLVGALNNWRAAARKRVDDGGAV